MSNRCILFWIIIAVSIVPIFAQQWKTIPKLEADSYEKFFKASKVNYPGDPTFDVTYYKLNLTITSNPNYLKGIVTVNGIIEQSSNGIFLDLQDTLKVDSVLLGNNKLSFTHENAKLNINFGRTYNSGENFSVQVYYQGVPGSSGFGSFEFSSHGNNEPAIWSLSEPYGASDWWPCKDTPADKADSSDVWVTCASNLTAASNGTLQKVLNNSDNTKTYEWKNSYPIAQYLISIAVSDYSVYTIYYHYSPSDSMPVINYIYPENLDSLKSNLDKTTSMLSIFSNIYGLYPFITEKYGHAEFGWNGGMEHQTCTSVGAFSEDVLSHELSHQWFGDKITCKDWQDIWLNEGFATYSAGLFREFYHGESSYNSYINSIRNGAKLAKGLIYVQDISSVNNIFDGNRTYDKGAMVLYMLRGIVGDSTFFKIMKTYASEPSLIYNVATTQDFENAAESVYGSSLSYFFDEWIFGENYPHYNYNWNYQSAGGNNLYQVNLEIKQSTNTNPVFFTMPIEIKISTDIGDTLIKVFNNQQDQQFNINVKGQPLSLTFDPDNLILKDTSSTTDISKTENVLNFKLEQNYPNPFNPTTVINYELPKDGFITLKIYNVLGKEVETLVNQYRKRGRYTISFNAINLPSGIYFYRLKSGDFVQSKKMILLK